MTERKCKFVVYTFHGHFSDRIVQFIANVYTFIIWIDAYSIWAPERGFLTIAILPIWLFGWTQLMACEGCDHPCSIQYETTERQRNGRSKEKLVQTCDSQAARLDLRWINGSDGGRGDRGCSVRGRNNMWPWRNSRRVDYSCAGRRGIVRGSNLLRNI